MPKKYYSLAELAEMTQSELVGDPDHLISNVADLNSASSEDLSFLSNDRYQQAMQESKAGVIFIAPNIPRSEGKNFLINENPSRSFQEILELFHQEANKLTGIHGHHPSAYIHPSSHVGEGATIGPNAVIDEEVRVGSNSFIGAGSYIGPNVTIGDNSTIHPNVTIRERCTIGNRVIIHPGAIIGSCGFGYTTGEDGRHNKLGQVGSVTIEDDVEIGANSTIDRSRFDSTTIGRGTKIDNQVQIGHGVQVGEDNIIVAQSGIAGSSKTGKHVVIAGQSGIAGHLIITDKVRIAAKSGVSKSIKEAGDYGGIPAQPIHEYNRNSVYFRNLHKYMHQLKALSQKELFSLGFGVSPILEVMGNRLASRSLFVPFHLLDSKSGIQ